MWKCTRRSLKATIRNGVFRCSTVLSTKVQKNKDPPFQQNCLSKLTPAVLQHYNQFCNLCKNTRGNFSNEKKESEEPKERTWFFSVLPSDVFCALKWGGLLAVGYTYLQYKIKTFSKLDFYEKPSVYNPDVYHKTLGYLINSFGIKPYNCVLPEVQAAKNRNGRQNFTEFQTQNLKSDEINFSSLEKAYQKVLGTLKNSLGTQCMQSGQHKEAFGYFIQSAEGEYAPGIFNLGICHEKGLGTSQNFERAAELYQKAADLGHPTAMYNLGVFYAQGKGGIEIDLKHARELFTAAAKLGQADAVKALQLEKEDVGEIPESDAFPNRKDKDKNFLSQLIFNELMNQSSSSSSSVEHFHVCDDEGKSSCDSFGLTEEKELDSTLGSDSGVLDLSPHSEPCVLLV